MTIAQHTASSRLLPKKLTELGRLRIGDREDNKSGRGTHPRKLDVFRLTSPNSPLLHFAASTYGGEVHPWVGEGAPTDDHDRPTQFELYTTVNSLDVLIPTFSAVSLDFEQWSAGGCQRRCTGEVITHCPGNATLIGSGCTCPVDDQERAAAAKTGTACARILRLNVLLPDLPGMGCWRLETKGYYATAELLGTLDMLQMAGQEHSIIEAVLRLEQRQVKRPGKGEGKGTLKFVVPVLWPKWTPRQLLSSAAERGLLLMSPAQPTPAVQKSLPDTITDLYGDTLTPGTTDDGTATVRAQIDAILTAQGVTETKRAAFWAKHERYASPGYLTQLKEKLEAEAERRSKKGEKALQEPLQSTQITEATPEVLQEPGLATADSGASAPQVDLATGELFDAETSADLDWQHAQE